MIILHLRMKRLSFKPNCQIGSSPSYLARVTAASTKEQEQLVVGSPIFGKAADEERLAGHLRLLDEQLKTARRELDGTSMRISELKLPKRRRTTIAHFKSVDSDESAQLVEKSLS